MSAALLTARVPSIAPDPSTEEAFASLLRDNCILRLSQGFTNSIRNYNCALGCVGGHNADNDSNKIVIDA